MILASYANPDGSLNLTAAAQMAALCAMVYEGLRENIEAFIGPESRLAYYQRSEGTWIPAFAVIESGPKRWFVISEGTISYLQALAQGSPLNCLTPVTLDLPTIGPCYGTFYFQVYRLLRDRIADIVPYNDPQLRLYLSGHSMGGGVAQVGGFEFARLVDPMRVQVLTLGQPKGAGDDHGWTHPLPHVYFRVNSQGDLVPGYPSSFVQWFVNYATFRVFSGLFPQGWSHYGTEVVLTNNGGDNIYAPPPNPLPRGLGLASSTEHFLDNYLARILLRAQVMEPD